jgi:hypothetical protein
MHKLFVVDSYFTPYPPKNCDDRYELCKELLRKKCWTYIVDMCGSKHKLNRCKPSCMRENIRPMRS